MSITVDELVRREVICCVSGLVSDLLAILPHVPYRVLQDTSFDYDELLRLGSTDDWEEPVEDFINAMDFDDLIIALDDAGVEDERDPLTVQEHARHAAVEAGSMDASDYEEPWVGLLEVDLRTKLFEHLKEEDELQEFAQEHRIDPHTREAYEFWAVTDWLAERLKEKGESVGDVGNLVVWGRCTTGQMISMDWVMQSIHSDLVAT